MIFDLFRLERTLEGSDSHPKLNGVEIYLNVPMSTKTIKLLDTPEKCPKMVNFSQFSSRLKNNLKIIGDLLDRYWGFALSLS